MRFLNRESLSRNEVSLRRRSSPTSPLQLKYGDGCGDGDGDDILFNTMISAPLFTISVPVRLYLFVVFFVIVLSPAYATCPAVCGQSAWCGAASAYECKCISSYVGNPNLLCLHPERHNVCALYAENALCNRIDGTCLCRDGYVGNGFISCSEVNECLTDNIDNSRCGDYGVCRNTEPGWVCDCDIGFTNYNSDETSYCVDIDECEVNNTTSSIASSPCLPEAQCVNNIGSYSCECPSDSVGDGKTACRRVYQCDPDVSSDISCHELANCVKVGSNFRCVCREGLNGDGLNMCTSHNSGPSIKLYGNSTFFVFQHTPFTEPGFFAEDNLADLTPYVIVSGVVNTDRPGVYILVYTIEDMDGNIAAAIERFIVVIDVDECELPIGVPGRHSCVENSICTGRMSNDTDAMFDSGLDFTCTCLQGFTGDGFVSCFNIIPSKNYCPDGFTLTGSGCEDINECFSSHGCPIGSRCENSFGSYSCLCPIGYRWRYRDDVNPESPEDGRCVDIDECVDMPSLCPAPQKCINVPNSYECRCYDSLCPEHAHCSDITSRKCTCDAGWSEDPGTGNCVDIDECSLAKHDCHLYAMCRNTAGFYACDCIAGFYPISLGIQNSLSGSNSYPCRDIRPPSIELIGDNPMVIKQYEKFIEPGFKAIDILTPFLTIDLTYLVSFDFIPAINTRIAGTYSVVYRVLDFSNNFAEITRIVKVNDIDECALSPDDKFYASCPQFSDCLPDVESPYSFTCVCRLGFMLIKGFNMCVDVNPPIVEFGYEIVEIMQWDEFHTVDHLEAYDIFDGDYIDLKGNVVISPAFIDTSMPGSVNINVYVTDASGLRSPIASLLLIIQDVDECESMPSPCHENAVCTNTQGSYHCRCISGFSEVNSVCIDDVPPVITLIGPNNMTLLQYDTWLEPGAYAYDLRGSRIDLSMRVTIEPQIVNTSLARTMTIFYNVMDDAGNDAIEVSRVIVILDIDECITGYYNCPGRSICRNVYQTYDCDCPPDFLEYRNGTFVCEDPCERDEISGLDICALKGNCIPKGGDHECNCFDGLISVDDGRSCKDMESPSLVLSKTRIVVNQYDDIKLPPFLAVDSFDGNLTSEVVPLPPFSSNHVGVFKQILFVSDSSGNVATAELLVVVTDVDECTLHLSHPFSASCEANAMCSSVNSTILCSCNLGFRDASPNESIMGAQCVDSTPPELTLRGSSYLRYTWTNSRYVDDGIEQAWDNVDGDLRSSVQMFLPEGLKQPNPDIGLHIVQFTVADAAGNIATEIRRVHIRLVTICDEKMISQANCSVHATCRFSRLHGIFCECDSGYTREGEECLDKTPPVITIYGNIEVIWRQLEPYVDAGAVANDVVDGAVNVQVFSYVNVAIPGVYFVHYWASDEAGNVAITKRRRVNIIDANECDGAYGSSFGHLCDPIMSVCVNTPGSYHCNCLAQDGFHATSEDRVCVDVKPPNLSLIGDNPTIIYQGTLFNATIGVSAKDNYDSEVSIEILTDLVDVSRPGQYFVKYRASDNAGNEAFLIREVLVLDVDECIIASNIASGVQIDTILIRYRAMCNLERERCENVVGSYKCICDSSRGFYGMDISGEVIVDSEGERGSFKCVDRDGPRLTLVGNYTVHIEQFDTTWVDPGVIVDDNLGPEQVTVNKVMEIDFTIAKHYRIIYTAVDAAGNLAKTIIRDVIIDDIDECSIGRDHTHHHNCGEDHKCVNRHGTYECQCSEGYYRVFMKGPCVPCECHGYGRCSISTGKCLECSVNGNAIGFNCDNCADNFIGSPLNETGCVPVLTYTVSLNVDYDYFMKNETITMFTLDIARLLEVLAARVRILEVLSGSTIVEFYVTPDDEGTVPIPKNVLVKLDNAGGIIASFPVLSITVKDSTADADSRISPETAKRKSAKMATVLPLSMGAVFICGVVLFVVRRRVHSPDIIVREISSGSTQPLTTVPRDRPSFSRAEALKNAGRLRTGNLVHEMPINSDQRSVKVLGTCSDEPVLNQYEILSDRMNKVSSVERYQRPPPACSSSQAFPLNDSMNLPSRVVNIVGLPPPPPYSDMACNQILPVCQKQPPPYVSLPVFNVDRGTAANVNSCTPCSDCDVLPPPPSYPNHSLSLSGASPGINIENSFHFDSVHYLSLSTRHEASILAPSPSENKFDAKNMIKTSTALDRVRQQPEINYPVLLEESDKDSIRACMDVPASNPLDFCSIDSVLDDSRPPAPAGYTELKIENSRNEYVEFCILPGITPTAGCHSSNNSDGELDDSRPPAPAGYTELKIENSRNEYVEFCILPGITPTAGCHSSNNSDGELDDSTPPAPAGYTELKIENSHSKLVEFSILPSITSAYRSNNLSFLKMPGCDDGGCTSSSRVALNHPDVFVPDLPRPPAPEGYTMLEIESGEVVDAMHSDGNGHTSLAFSSGDNNSLCSVISMRGLDSSSAPEPPQYEAVVARRERSFPTSFSIDNNNNSTVEHHGDVSAYRSLSTGDLLRDLLRIKMTMPSQTLPDFKQIENSYI